MKRASICCCIFMMVPSVCFGLDKDSVAEFRTFNAGVAIELQSKTKTYQQWVGKLSCEDYICNEITIIKIFDCEKPFSLMRADVYELVEKKRVSGGIYSVKGKNRMSGSTISGTLDASVLLRPRVSLLNEGGDIYTNISEIGRAMKKRCIPKLDIGWDAGTE